MSVKNAISVKELAGCHLITYDLHGEFWASLRDNL